MYVAYNVVHVALTFDLTKVEFQCVQFRQALKTVLPDFKPVVHLDNIWFSAAHQVKATCDFQHIHGGAQHVVLGGIAALAGTIFGIFNFAKINALASRVRRQQHILDADLHVLRNHETCMSWVERDMRVVNDTLTYLLHVAKKQSTNVGRMYWMQSFQIQFGLLNGHILIINEGWVQLMDNKFPVRWLKMSEITRLHGALWDKASQMGGMLPLQHVHDLFHLPTSFIVEGQQIMVFLHVLVVHEWMKLYRHLPVPIQGNGMDFWRVHGDFDHLLVSDMNKFHKEVNLEVIARSCHRMGDSYLCEHLGDLARKMTHTCLGSLFVQQMDFVHEQCRVEQMKEDWMMVQTRHYTFLVFSRTETMMTTECRNGSRSNARLVGIEEVITPATCQTYSEEFALQSSASSTMSFVLENTMEWNNTRFRGIQEETGEGVPDLGQIQVGRRDDGAWQAKDRARREPGHDLYMWLGIGLGVGSAIVWAGAIGFLYFRFRRLPRPADIPEVHE